MDSQTIEAQIKGLLGLAGGGSVTDNPAPGAYPRHRDKKPQKQNNQSEIEKSRKTKGQGKSEGRKGSDGSPSQAPVGANATEQFFLSEAKKELKFAQPEDYTAPDLIVEFLESKYLRPLKKKSTKFQRARWFCHLCEYHCDNLSKCYDHYMDTRHSRLTKLKEIDFTLENLPSASKLQCDSLNALLSKNNEQLGLTEDEIEKRQSVAVTIKNILRERMPDCDVRLYGSSLTGFGLVSSDINLDLQISKEQQPHMALLEALDLLQQSRKFRNVRDEFTSKLPAIILETDEGVEVKLSLNNQLAFQTSSILRDYIRLDPRVKVLGVNFRLWASITKLDRQAEGTLSPHTFPILLIYFLQQIKEPVVPCIHDYLEDSDDDVYVPNNECLRNWKSKNNESIAQLWIQLFEFYSLTFNSTELVVSIRKSQETTNEEKDWKSKKLAIEDPYSTKRNLCRSIQHPSVFNYIADAFKTGYLYFGTIQTSHGPIITKILPSEDGEETGDEGLGDWTLESWLTAKGTELTKKQVETAIRLVPKNMVTFSFSEKHLTDGSVPAVLCSVCSNEGHVTNNCPEEQLPPLLQLPDLKPEYLRALDRLCYDVVRSREPQDAELSNRDHIMVDLNRYIRKFFKNAELTLFGSSSNGFAFRHSDLDISLTFKDIPTSDELDCIQIIEQLADKIKRMSGVRNVEAITSAKVPIIKLFYQNLNVEADISLYNVLARENTKLLSLYAELDPRVRSLGYMAKHFAKKCDIGDASRGSLSSYAYILMMIFYLQQTSPPVIPVLQEMYKGEKPQFIVDGWNAWFQKDRSIVSRWKSENLSSVGQLWIGFLSFYAGEWDDRKYVVSIRQKKPLTKFEKMWNSPCIAIEDPFELSHNLGVGISRRMNIYIKKSFINGRTLFGNPKPGLPRTLPSGYRTFEEYFFDHRLLTNGAPPNDRGCRACGKIGHLVADCPRKRAADNKKKQQKERLRTQSEQNLIATEQGERRVTDRDGGDRRNRTRSEIPPPAQVHEGKGENEHVRTTTEQKEQRLQALREQLPPVLLPLFQQPPPNLSAGPHSPLPHAQRRPAGPVGAPGGAGGQQQIPGLEVPREMSQNGYQSAGAAPGTPEIKVESLGKLGPIGPPRPGLPGLSPPVRHQQGHPLEGQNLPFRPPGDIEGQFGLIGPRPPLGAPPYLPFGQPLRKPELDASPSGFLNLRQPSVQELEHFNQLSLMMKNMPKQGPLDQDPSRSELKEKKSKPVEGGFDLSAFAAAAGVSPNKPPPMQAINLEDLEKSMFEDSKESTPTNLDKKQKESTPNPPPGFNQLGGGDPLTNQLDLQLNLLHHLHRQQALNTPPLSLPQHALGLPAGLPQQALGLPGGLQQQQQQQQQQAPFIPGSMPQTNPMLFPFLPVGIPLDPRLQMAPMGQPAMVGQIPRMFGPMMIGQPGGPGFIVGQDPPPLPMCSLPGLPQQPQAAQNESEGQLQNPSQETQAQKPQTQQHSLVEQPQQYSQQNPMSCISPHTILPPARAENNSPDGSIQTAPSPLPAATSPCPVDTPPPLLLGWQPQNNLFQVPGTAIQPGLVNQPRILPPFSGRFSPLQSHQSGFQSSVLFPSDIQHPLSQGTVEPDSQPRIGVPEAGIGSSGDDGLPNSPPIDMRQFDYDSLDPLQQ